MTLTTLTDQFSLDLKELNRKGHQYFLWYSLHFLLFQWNSDHCTTFNIITLYHLVDDFHTCIIYAEGQDCLNHI